MAKKKNDRHRWPRRKPLAAVGTPIYTEEIVDAIFDVIAMPDRDDDLKALEMVEVLKTFAEKVAIRTARRASETFRRLYITVTPEEMHEQLKRCSVPNIQYKKIPWRPKKKERKKPI